MAPTIVSFPYMMRPDVPAERIHAIRDAMMRVFEKPAFREASITFPRYVRLDIADETDCDYQ